jgi:predicted lipoprotein
MKRIVWLFIAGVTAVVLSVNFSCSKSGGAGNGNSGGSGSDSILVNIGNNIILPGYQGLAISVNSLDSSITDFNTGPNSTKFTNVQTLFKAAYVAWQSASEYDYFGPAADAQPTLAGINVFPTNATLIESNVSAGDNNVSTFANTAAKGFPALDYLLFGAGAGTLANYTTGAGAANRKSYLSAVSADIKTEVNAVLNQWSASGGNYIKTFVTGSGNSVSSSLGLLINSLNQDFENLKNYRLGVPLGLIPVGSGGKVAPMEVEAYYSGISSQLALAQLRAVQGIYLGTGGSGNGLGLITYLVNANAQYNGGSLSDAIQAAFVTDVTDLQAVPDPLSQTIQTNPSGATAAFTQSQKLVALLKTDMPSALGVLITYGDNDGD